MTADRNGPFSVVRYGHSFFSSESEFPEISPSNISIEQKGSVPKKKKKSVPSQHSRLSNKHNTEQPLFLLLFFFFIRRLGYLDVGKKKKKKE